MDGVWQVKNRLLYLLDLNLKAQKNKKIDFFEKTGGDIWQLV